MTGAKQSATPRQFRRIGTTSRARRKEHTGISDSAYWPLLWDTKNPSSNRGTLLEQSRRGIRK